MSIDARMQLTLSPGDDDGSPRLLRVADEATGSVLAEVRLTPSQIAALLNGDAVAGRGVLRVALPHQPQRTDVTIRFDPLCSDRDALRAWAVRTAERDLTEAGATLVLSETAIAVTFSFDRPLDAEAALSMEAVLSVRAQGAGFVLDPRWDRTRPWYAPPPVQAGPAPA